MTATKYVPPFSGADSIGELIKRASEYGKRNGFWDDYIYEKMEYPESIFLDKEILVKLGLIMSEGAEAFEAYLKGADVPDDYLPQYPGWQVELAGVVIRVMDMAGNLGVSLQEIILAKMDYNDKGAD